MFLLFFACSSLHAEPPDGEAVKVSPEPARRWSASIRWENDVFSGTDRFYTNGASVSIAHTGKSWVDPFLEWLPWERRRQTVSYELGQIMVTPGDITRKTPDPDDRPYAGILYGALSIHIDVSDRYHGLKLIAGVMGPSSLAEETQRVVHEWVGSDQAEGWDKQLHNEPVLNLVYEHRRKYGLIGSREQWAAEALPVAGAMLGNVLTQGQVGGQVRIGYNIPDDFGMTLMRGMVHLPPPRKKEGARSQWGVFAYGGASANFVLRNIALDGNTWKDSPSVDKEWFVPAAELGIAVGNDRFLASFSYVFWGCEFEGQPEYSEFGALTFSYFF